MSAYSARTGADAVHAVPHPLQGGARPDDAGRRLALVQSPVQIPEQATTRNRRGAWGFQPSDSGWMQNLTDYVTFCEENGRRPRARGTDPAERRLARWISSQRQDFRAFILPQARRMMLDERIPGWAD